MIASTSALAYDAHAKNGGICRQARQIKKFVLDNPRELGWSRSELSASTGIRLSSVCARVNELVACGALQILPIRKCAITRKKIIPVGVQ